MPLNLECAASGRNESIRSRASVRRDRVAYSTTILVAVLV
jgi:hypothetical protein